MLSFVSLGSGSKGNAFLVTDGESVLQIDMGRPREVLEAFLSAHHLKLSDINALLITHTHFDHISTVKTIYRKGRRKGPEIYALSPKYKEKDYLLPLGEKMVFGNLSVLAFPTSHDSLFSCGFRIEEKEGESLVYITDTGFLPIDIFPYIENPTYLVLESNHDPFMLASSSRPLPLKRRIKGDKGHLSNEQCASYFVDIVGPNTKEIYLAHLSEECNKEEFALTSAKNALEKLGRNDISLTCLKQWINVYGGHPWP